ncbi:MAG: GGDEF domain-containing protein [Candidatus Limnocylindrales bacterium]
MTTGASDDAMTAAAVEALVVAIEAKEARRTGETAAAEPAPRTPRGRRAASPVVASPIPEATRRRRAPIAWDPDPPELGSPTGLVDRQRWTAVIHDEAERQDRYGRPAAVVIAELDTLDGPHGARVMDRVAPAFGRLLVSITRASDRVTRLSTGRFGVLLLHTDAEGAARFAARAILEARLWLATSPWQPELMVGWAGASSGDELRDAVRTAEAHLATHGDPAP